MATKLENILDPNSCWNKAEMDEPVFILRATDRLSPKVVTLWSVQYVEEKGGWQRMSETQQRKFESALQVAESMRQFYNDPKRFDSDIPF